MAWFTVKLHNDLSYKVKLVNISFEFCAFNLRPCAIPKNKIGVFVFTNNFTQLILADTKVLRRLLNCQCVPFPKWNLHGTNVFTSL